MGGCGLLLPPITVWKEKDYVRRLPDKSYRGNFPVLVQDKESGKYYVDRWGDLRPGSGVVTNGFDWEKIKRDLGGDEDGWPVRYKVRVLKETDRVVEIYLRSPASEGEIKSWYEIRDGEVVPVAVLDMSRGLPIIWAEWGMICGVGSLIVFLIVVRRKPRPPDASNGEIFRDMLGSLLSAILGVGAGLFLCRFLIGSERWVMGLWNIDF
jgi:hypothetical protein